MTVSTHLKLPQILPAQAQKHITHNEALAILDALTQLVVPDRDLEHLSNGVNRVRIPKSAEV